MAVLQDRFRQSPRGLRLSRHLTSYRVIIFALGVLLTLGGSLVIGATDKGIWVVAGVMGLVMSLVVMLRPRIGLFILVAFVYTNLSTVLMEAFGLPSLNKILVALIFISVIGTQVMQQKKPLIFRATEGAVLLYMFITSLSLIVRGGVNAESFDAIVDSFKDFLILLIIVQLAPQERVWKQAQWLLIACAMFLSILTWYQVVTDNYQNNFYGLATSRDDSVEDDTTSGEIVFFRVGGPVGDPNYYAQMLLMVFPLALYRFLDEKRNLVRGPAAVAVMFIAGAIVFTYSRAALMVIVTITFLILVERRINLYKVIPAAIVILIVVTPLLPEGYRERMLTITGLRVTPRQQTDYSAQGRTSELLVAYQMFRDYPIMGIGYHQYEPNYLRYATGLGLDSRLEERQAHNFYMEAAAETGVVGFTAMVTMFAMIFQALRHARRDLIRLKRPDLVSWVAALQFGLLAYLLNSIFLHDDYSRYLFLSIALAVSSTALVNTLIDQARQEQQKQQLAAIRADTQPIRPR